MSYRIKKVADIAGISVRTLHHYDNIGLLRPAAASPAGYRLYSNDDLSRLQEILFFRELGFGLNEIKEILDRPGYDRRGALLTHKKILQEKNLRIVKLIRAVDMTLYSMERGSTMSKEEMFGAFDEATVEEYKKEARERWGGTGAYKESERKTAKYTKADWERINAASGDIHRRLAEVMEAGHAPSDSEAQEAVGRWFKHICEYFYTCTPEIFKGLGEMYVADPRFKKVYEDIKPGLAEFAKDAMTFFADSIKEQ